MLPNITPEEIRDAFSFQPSESYNELIITLLLTKKSIIGYTIKNCTECDQERIHGSNGMCLICKKNNNKPQDWVVFDWPSSFAQKDYVIKDFTAKTTWSFS